MSEKHWDDVHIFPEKSTRLALKIDIHDLASHGKVSPASLLQLAGAQH